MIILGLFLFGILIALVAALPFAFVSMLVVGAIFPSLGWGFWYFYGISVLLGMIFVRAKA